MDILTLSWALLALCLVCFVGLVGFYRLLIRIRILRKEVRALEPRVSALAASYSLGYSPKLIEWVTLLGLNGGLSDDECRRKLEYIAKENLRVRLVSSGRLASSRDSMILRSLVAEASVKNSKSEGKRIQLVEVGVLFGVGMASIVSSLRASVASSFLVTGIDPFDGYYESNRLDVGTWSRVTREIAEDNLHRAGADPTSWQLISGMSPEAILDANHPKTVDFLILDGDHTLEGVQKDFEAYFPLVSAGGYIVFDDFESVHWPEVTAFVRQVVLQRDDLSFVGADFETAVFRKAA
jgi:hypothetical protein